METRDLTTPRGVLGDFVLACGPEAGAWIRGLAGFAPVSGPTDEIQVATRGGARHGTEPDGKQWLALADLIEGRLGDGVRALAPGTPPQAGWRGRFAQVVFDPGARRIAALTDHFSSVSLYVLVNERVLLLGTDLRLLAASPWCRREIDLESVYNYLNFACIPAPGTIFRDIRRFEPGTRLRWEEGRVSWDRYFIPEYLEDLRGTDEDLAHELRDRMIASVHAYRPDDSEPWGCFLSGGTDSSSIATILSRQGRPGRVRSFSIGFAEEGYDELGFAETAARACGAEPTFARVSREQAQSLVGRLIESYDQPFGNASAIPTMACVDLAHERGVDCMLAGDGGDEIFGGNQRYAKDQVMEAWYSMPGPVKRLALALGHLAGRTNVNLLNRVENFFERASLPNPDRFYSDDSFASDHYDELLRPEFRREVARDTSLRFMRSVYNLGSSGSPLHRIMRLDLLMAIAQNDLRKVDGAARSVGISVRFPYLDPALVAFVNRLPQRYKVRGLEKRTLFKKAMRDILPEAILRKKKQGFGLPITVWLRSDPQFQSTVRDALFDRTARARGWWETAYVERLMAEHLRGSWDHADDLWRLFALELWLRKYVDGR
jgi:asparagine synthase (glutamine-hydrolysing)